MASIAGFRLFLPLHCVSNLILGLYDEFREKQTVNYSAAKVTLCYTNIGYRFHATRKIRPMAIECKLKMFSFFWTNISILLHKSINHSKSFHFNLTNILTTWCGPHQQISMKLYMHGIFSNWFQLICNVFDSSFMWHNKNA